MTALDAVRPAFDALRAASARATPDYEQRMAALAALRDGVRARQDDLARAVSDDFGGRAREETLLLELLPLYDQIRHARRHLKRWMRRRNVRSTWFLRPSRAFYQYQPLGVVGIIGAWNYQLLLTLGPLIDALAAGNRVMVKPSEVTPRSAEMIASIVADSFAPDYVSCVTGGLDIARAFAALPFDHLFFTGSGEVGRAVMRSAADNLTPVTLELGGKSPAIVHESYPLARAAERIVSAKVFNAGQTCIAPDYVLLPAGREADFESHARRVVSTLLPRLAGNADYTRIVNARHHDRLTAAIADAEAKGGRLVFLANADGADGRVIAPALVFGAADGMSVMQQEIFGPVLPVVSYRTLEDALAFVNARPRPLALYYFDDDASRIDLVLQKTMSGGVTVNDCMLHFGQHNLPFGGVGASGMGQYHGFDGFVTFSKKRGVMVQTRWAGSGLLRPPYTSRKRAVIDALLRFVSRA